MIDKDMLGWMQAQWRDCADRAAQMRIFRDMTRAPVEVICAALGEDPAPWIKAKKTYRKWTPEEDELLLQLRAEGVDCADIVKVMGREIQSIYSRLKKLRRTGELTVSEPVSEKPASEKKEKKKKSAVAWDQSAEEEIIALLEYEERIIAELKAVREEIARRRERLAELLSIAGGVLRDDEK